MDRQAAREALVLKRLDRPEHLGGHFNTSMPLIGAALLMLRSPGVASAGILPDLGDRADADPDQVQR